MLAHKVFQTLKEVLDAERLSYAPIKSSIASRDDLQANNDGLTLFKHMTVDRRPEIRAQEAIFPHLIAAGWDVRREKTVYIKDKCRIFDFVVTDDCSEVIVELKHYSPHQTKQFVGLLGPVVTKAKVHLQSLHKDFHKRRPSETPLIQLGLFTAVEGWRNTVGVQVPRKDSGSYFIEKFARGPLVRGVYEAQARQALGNWAYRHLFACPTQTATASDFCVGPSSEYTSNTNVTVRGRVNYFLGIAAQQT